ncbi:MAG: hypothetical protein QM652_04430 [Legionella sp.]|uniref:hypothetical protein n=1 Tax=Legionella sp. TaxID=459 RepID=UPI0039E58B83
MKMIKKAVFMIGCSVSTIVIAAPGNSSLYDKLYQLAEKMHYMEYALTPEKQKIIEELSNNIATVINEPNEITCGNKISVFKEAYKWSYSSDGLDYTTSNAEKFATGIVSKSCPEAYLNVFKLSYNFAFKSNGMDKPRSGALQIATKISDYEESKFYTQNTLQCYMENYEFAYSSSGMNKTRAASEVFANQQCLG